MHNKIKERNELVAIHQELTAVKMQITYVGLMLAHFLTEDKVAGTPDEVDALLKKAMMRSFKFAHELMLPQQPEVKEESKIIKPL